MQSLGPGVQSPGASLDAASAVLGALPRSANSPMQPLSPSARSSGCGRSDGTEATHRHNEPDPGEVQNTGVGQAAASVIPGGSILLLEPRRQVSTATNQTDSSTSSCSRLTSLASPMFVHDWTVEDVAKWLGGHGLKHVADVFRENRITGDVLLDIGREDLAEMGICALGDRMRIVKAIEQLRVDTKQVVGSTAGPATTDFFFLGASPLVTVGEGGTRPLEPIDLEAEQHAIRKALVDANRACRFQFEFATIRKLTWAMLQRSCTVLFFSGHTLQDGKWLLETETGEALSFDPYELFQHDEMSALSQTARERNLPSEGFRPILPAPAESPREKVEKGPAEGQPVSKGVVNNGMCLRLVVLCSCHSCIPASLFIDAGVPHVVAVERSETVLDISARVFVQSLCHSLLVGNTIQNAFKHAQWLVKHNECLNTSGYRATAKKEAQKFVLLPKGANHATVLFPSLARGAALDCSAARPPVQFPRTRLDLTVVRQVELWRVLQAMRRHRFVQVLGPPGVGKKTLVCLVANFVWQRHIFPEGIHYVHVDDLKWVVAVDWSVRRLLPQGVGGDDNDTARAAEAERAAAANWQLYHESFLDQHFSLPGYRLLVLDGCHALYQKCRGAFVQWLQRLLTENPGLQVLVTGQTPIREPVVAPACGGGGFLSEQDCAEDVGDGVVEVGELSETDAVRLLKWRCHVLPEAASFLDDHGARLAHLCGRLPLALCVCARWLLAQLPRTDPNKLLEAMEDDMRRLEVLKPCTLVFESAISALPPLLQHSLYGLAGLHAAFGTDIAAAIWAVEPAEADLRLRTLREHHLLELAGGSLLAGLPADLAGVGPTEADGTLYCMQPLLRLHLCQQRNSEQGTSSLGALADPEIAARLVAGYAGRIASTLVRREEFANVQLVLDLAGATCSFLALLWAVRGIGWAHTWLGDVRRVQLYERALAVLAALSRKTEEQGASRSPSKPGAAPPAPPPAEAWAEAAPAAKAGAPERPSDIFLAAPPGELPDAARVEASMRRMVQQGRQYKPDRDWADQRDWIFVHGSNINPAEVWGPELEDRSQPLLRPHGKFDELALPMISKSHLTNSAVVSALSSPQAQQRRVCEAMLELTAACRGADPGRSLRLAHDVVTRLCRQQAPEGSKAIPEVGNMCNDVKCLLADAMVEFSLGYLSYRGPSGRSLSADLIDVAVSIGQRTDPMRSQHFRTLRLAAFHALAFERDPCKAERLLKRCLELKLQKLNTWQHVEIAETLGDCGMLCRVLGDLSHAESMLRTAVGVWRQLLDRTHPKLVAALLDLAGLLATRERWGDAEDMFQQAAFLLREASDGSLQLYRALNRLALFHRQRGKPEVAVPILRECISGVEQALGAGEHLAVAALRHNLALCLMAVHGESSPRASEACALLRQVHAAYKAQLPPSSPSALAAQRSFAQCLLLLKRPHEAVPLLEEAMQITEDLGSYGPQERGRLHMLLSRARMLQGSAEESRRHFEWVLQHPAAAASMDESERLAAQEFLQQPSGDPLKEKHSRAKELPEHGAGVARDAWAEEPPPSGESSCAVEPQGEPEGLVEGPRTGDGRHLGFIDVEETSLSVLNRVQYLLGDRVQACLGVLPPLCDGHQGATSDEPGAEIPRQHEEPCSLAALFPRMELVCLRLPGQDRASAPQATRAAGE